jgi:hypothetical protein
MTNVPLLSNFVDGDPVARLILGKRRLHPLVVFAIALGIGVIDDLILGPLTGYWNSKGNIMGVVDDLPRLGLTFIVQPSIWAFFAWIPYVAVRTFDRLGHVITQEAMIPFANFRQDLFKFAGSGMFNTIAIMLALGLTASAISVSSISDQTPNWGVALGWHFWLIWLPREFGALYAFSYAVLRTLLVIFGLNLAFKRFKIIVYPYHEDGAGGLGFIGQLAVGIMRLPLILVVFTAGEILNAMVDGKGLGTYNVIAELITLPVLVLACFVAPLIFCRWAMELAKDESLHEIAQKIGGQLKIVNDNQSSNDDLEKLLSLIDLQTRLRKDFPTLPINTTIVREFSLGFFIALAPSALSAGVDLYHLL